jgi:hypothetical protein
MAGGGAAPTRTARLVRNALRTFGGELLPSRRLDDARAAVRACPRLALQLDTEAGDTARSV